MPKRPDREIMGDNNDSFTIDSHDPNSNTKVVVHRSGSIEVQRFPNQEYQDKYETIARTDQVATSAPYKTLHSDDLLNNTIASAAAASASMTDAKASTFQPYSATGTSQIAGLSYLPCGPCRRRFGSWKSNVPNIHRSVSSWRTI